MAFGPLFFFQSLSYFPVAPAILSEAALASVSL